MSQESIFLAYDIRGKVSTELTPEIVKNIGRAFADWLPQEGLVAVGRDMRPDSEELSKSLIAGITAQGRDVWDLGLITSDMSYFAIGKYMLAGAAMITASHNPGEYNGIKLYRDHVIAVGLDSGLDEIRDAVTSGAYQPEAAHIGSYTQRDITEEWLQHVVTFLDDDIPAYKVVVDAGNGMAAQTFAELEPYVPFDVTEMYFELDGSFPNHEANPQKPENMHDLQRKVKQTKSDFGIAFDGDGDRAGFVDNKGRIVSGSDVLSIAAKLYLEKYPGAEIVHEVRTSRATRELIQEWGGTPIRTKAGRVSIGTHMRERHAPFGGETTGHLFFKENYYADSGLIAAMVVISALHASGKTLADLVDSYHRYEMIHETNFSVQDKSAVLARLTDAFAEEAQDTLDGLTVNFEHGWFNVRASNTEPLLRLNAEARTKKELDTLVAKVTALIKD
jgi:phosphomannomutase